MRRLLLTLALACSVAACTRSAPSPVATQRPGATASTALAANATVRSVTDGDTIGVVVDGQDEVVRLIGIDTPEVKDPQKPVQCYGEAASAFTKQVLPKGTAVRLERDVEARDRYGRLLAYVHRASDGLFVNLELARQGYADVLTIPPNVAHAGDFRAAVASAREARRGLWGSCTGFGVPAAG
jgi:micrococcal nuclease